MEPSKTPAINAPSPVSQSIRNVLKPLHSGGGRGEGGGGGGGGNNRWPFLMAVVIIIAVAVLLFMSSPATTTVRVTTTTAPAATESRPGVGESPRSPPPEENKEGEAANNPPDATGEAAVRLLFALPDWSRQRFTSWHIIARSPALQSTAVAATPTATGHGNFQSCAPFLTALPQPAAQLNHSTPAISSSGRRCDWIRPKVPSGSGGGTPPLLGSAVDTGFAEDRITSVSKPSLRIGTQITTKAAVMHVQDARSGAGGRREYRLSFVDPVACMQKRGRILFIGHSHTRFLASMLCMMIGADNCNVFDDHSKIVTVVRFPSTSSSAASSERGKIAFVYIQANVDIAKRLELVQGDLANITRLSKTQGESSLGSSAAADRDFFTHVVTSIGPWDLMGYDSSPRETAARFQRGLEAIADRFTGAEKIIVHLHHAFRPDSPLAAVPSGITPRARQKHLLGVKIRRQCFSPPRVERMRLATLCGVADAAKKMEAAEREHVRGRVQDEKKIRFKGLLEVFDTYEATASRFALDFVDVLGHHYQDLLLEGLVQQLLRNHICVPPPQVSVLNDEGNAISKTNSSHVGGGVDRYATLFEGMRRLVSVTKGPGGATATDDGNHRLVPLAEAYPTLLSARKKDASTENEALSLANEPSSSVCAIVDVLESQYVPTLDCSCLKSSVRATHAYCRVLGRNVPDPSRLP